MLKDQIVSPLPPFDYGVAVRWQDRGNVMRGSICGFRKPSDSASSKTVMALVELPSGEAVEIPLDELELLDHEQ